MAGLSPAQRIKALAAIYAQVPPIDCQGLCHTSCGPIQMTRTEHLATERRGVTIPDRTVREAGAWCEALTMFKRCAIYEARPLLCRLWGVIEVLPCTYGCRPERYLTGAQGYELLAQAYAIDGQKAMVRLFREGAAAMREPGAEAAFREFLTGGLPADQLVDKLRGSRG